jgi:hypothetical protein
MKRQATLLTIAFILLLTACGAHIKHSMASVPASTTTMAVTEPSTIVQPRTGSTISIQDIISWFAYELLSTVTDRDDDFTAHIFKNDGDLHPDRSGSNADGAADPDPYRIRTKAQFRAPVFPGATDARRSEAN